MSYNRILILTGYDYSQCFKAIEEYNFEVLVPKNEALLTIDARFNLKESLGEKLVEVNYCDVANHVRQQAPDILITFGWRRIIPNEIINSARLAINIHPAILPEYKGYHPVPHVLINDETEHGITAHVITSDLDAGDIVHIVKFKIDKFSTLKSLQSKVNEIMPQFISNLLKNISNDNIELMHNDSNNTVVIAGKRTPSDSEIPLNLKMEDAYNLIRSCDDERFPAYLMIEEQKVYVSLHRAKSTNRRNKFDI